MIMANSEIFELKKALAVGVLCALAAGSLQNHRDGTDHIPTAVDEAARQSIAALRPQHQIDNDFTAAGQGKGLALPVKRCFHLTSWLWL